MIGVLKLKKGLVYLTVALTFLGYYTVLLLFFNMGLAETSRQLTVPLRLLVTASLALLFLLNIQHNRIIKETIIFVVFALFYYTRIWIDFTYREDYFMSINDVALYFTSFAFIPFIAIISFRIKDEYVDGLFKALLYSGFSFSLLAVLFYARFIGQTTRLAENMVGEAVLSPLALSYSASLIIGALGVYFINNKTNFWTKIIGYSTIVLSLVPFFLGSSRGSLISLFLPLLFYFFVGRSTKFIIRSTVIFCILITCLIYLDIYFGSGLLTRFLSIYEAIEEGKSSAVRLDIWKAAFDQFLQNPIFGDKLKVNGYNMYAHNLFVEVLHTTGLLGFIPFAFLVAKAFKICFQILKWRRDLFWIPTIFIQAFTQNMFSGALYTASWFWTSMALLFTLSYFKKYEKV